MGYDWETIFENKTNKELYDIVIGRVILSKDAVLLAKQELERRDFDFNNLEANKAAWQLSNLIEEENFAQSGIAARRANYIQPKILVFIVTGIMIIYFSLNELTNYDIPLGFAVFFMCFASFLVLLNNFMYKKQKQAHDARIEKIKELKEKLDKKNLLTQESPIHEEIIRHRKKEIESYKVLRYITIGIFLMFLIVLLLKMIIR